MRLYNVTDKPLPRQEQALNLTLRKAGVILEPGGYVDLHANFSLGQIAGWMASGWAVKGELPDWYTNYQDESSVMLKSPFVEEPTYEEDGW